ncbi:MAG: hypothetical protein M1814_006362 [Vezdaea aestivalis]|nr:MAG: hypothetical protein M1814_006362 [Vezdaea aestivalis]
MAQAQEEHSHIHKPVPRRAFSFTPASSEASFPPTPALDSTMSPGFLDPNIYSSPSATPSRTHSILNLTASTLYGIYSPAEESNDTTTSWLAKLEPTPGPDGLEHDHDSAELPQSPSFFPAPSPLPSQQRAPAPQGYKQAYLPVAIRTLALFVFGVAYGAIITHLHDHKQLVPAPLTSLNRHNWRTSFFWGVAGVGLGSLLPWVDFLLESSTPLSRPVSSSSHTPTPSRPTSSHNHSRPTIKDDSNSDSVSWTPIIRSLGAFIGIAFAIRKLPWASTLQLSLTLALANPVLWYMLDRSTPGFVLSTFVGVVGTGVLLGVNPAIVPTPPLTRGAMPSANASFDTLGQQPKGIITLEGVGVGTWIASVLFCSCVCFGSIGRRLSAGGPKKVRRAVGA